MKLPIRALPVIENWDCHSCGNCCRGTTVILDQDDVQQLRSQKWDSHADFRDTPVTTRESLLGGKQVLSRKPDGSCVFLGEDQRCRIHEEFGEAAKPSVCRMFPFQLVPLDKHINLTLRFSCPSAVAGKGRPLQERVKQISRSDLPKRFVNEGQAVPRIAKNGQRNWRDYLFVADVLKQITCDDRLPLVRRLVHGVCLCELLGACNLTKPTDKEFRELVEIFQDSASEQVSEYFRDRAAPTMATGFLFRQAAVHFIRSHPTFPPAASLSSRIQLLWASVSFALGGKNVPRLHPHFADSSFEQLEEPIGPLAPELLEPLDRYFESNTRSLQYAIGAHSRTLVESYRNLVLGFPMAMWVLRLSVGRRAPAVEDMVDVVSMLDRGQGGAAISATATWLGNSGKLEELIAWYAR